AEPLVLLLNFTREPGGIGIEQLRAHRLAGLAAQREKKLGAFARRKPCAEGCGTRAQMRRLGGKVEPREPDDLIKAQIPQRLPVLALLGLQQFTAHVARRAANLKNVGKVAVEIKSQLKLNVFQAEVRQRELL